MERLRMEDGVYDCYLRLFLKDYCSHPVSTLIPSLPLPLPPWPIPLPIMVIGLSAHLGLFSYLTLKTISTLFLGELFTLLFSIISGLVSVNPYEDFFSVIYLILVILSFRKDCFLSIFTWI